MIDSFFQLPFALKTVIILWKHFFQIVIPLCLLSFLIIYKNELTFLQFLKTTFF